MLANDSDMDHGASLTVTGASLDAPSLPLTNLPPSGVTVSVHGNEVVYDPGNSFQYLAQGETAIDEVYYTISDEHGATAMAAAFVTVTGVNDTPVAVGDTATVSEDSVVSIDVLANDSDVDATDTLTIVSTSGAVGSTSIINGEIVYNPISQYQSLGAGETAHDVFNYTISDGHGGIASTTVDVLVQGQNDAPDAVDDHFGAAVPGSGEALDAFVVNYSTDAVLTNDGSGNFSVHQSVNSGPVGDAVALGDLNEDGYLDAVLGNFSAVDTVWLNDGSGTFYANGSVPSLFGNYTRAVALGDINDDGHLDAAFANSNFGLRYALGDGSGGFGSQTTLYGGSGVDVALADVNGDDQLDALLLNSSGVTVFLNDGSGNLTSGHGPAFGGLFAPKHLAVADLNEDGYTDLFIADTCGGSGVWLNDGSGHFTAGVSEGYGTAIALGDVNDDGHVDAVLGAPGGTRILLGDGAGGFAVEQTLAASSPLDVQLGDLDGNGSLDLFVVNGSSVSTVWLNNGNGTFTSDGSTTGGYEAALGNIDGLATVMVSPGDPGLLESGSLTVTTGDLLANDSDVDINDQLTVTAIGATALGGSATLVGDQVIYDTNGNFETLAEGQTAVDTFTYTISDGHGGTDIATVSVTINGENDAPIAHDDHFGGAGTLDAFVVNWLGQPAHVYINDGAATFSDSGQAIGASFSTPSRDVALADLNGDGHVDAFVANFSANQVWLNDGHGTFTSNGQALGIENSEGVALGDLNGDGVIDALVGNYGVGNRVWMNDGTGHFTDAGQSLGTGNTRDIGLADFNGDGTLDAFVVNSGQGDRIWLNDGNGTFSDSGQSLGAAAGRNVVLTDLNGDGNIDAFVANDGANEVWLNDGHGNFTSSGQELGSADSEGIAFGDVDGDGDLDAFVANHGANEVWLNDGSGHFTDSGQALGSFASQDVALGDLNGDGTLDAYVANYGSDPDRVWLNDGSGHFVDSGQAIGALSGIGVALGRIDDPNLIYEDGPAVTFASSDLLANDVDVDNGAALSIVAIGEAQGSVSLDGSGHVIYDASGAYESLAAGETGIDTFSYTISDEHGATSIATVTITVAGQNDVPVAVDDTVTVTEDNSALTVNVLANDHDVDTSDILRVIAIDTAGVTGHVEIVDNQIVFDPNGQFETLAVGETAVEVISYTIYDGQGPGSTASADLTVTVTGVNDAPVAHDDHFGQNGVGLGVFVANNGQADQLWINDGSGHFQNSGQALDPDPHHDRSHGVAVADVNGDGHLDAIVAYDSENSPGRVWLNDGSGHFVDSGEALSRDAYDVQTADLNGDGAPDAFFFSDNTYYSHMQVWLNDGSGHFHDNGQDLGFAAGEGALHDVNGDGFVDAVDINNNGYAEVWLNDGSGTFSRGDVFGTFEYSRLSGIALGDFNGDGAFDVFASVHRYGSFGGNANMVFLNDGSGHFTGGVTLAGYDPHGLALGDFNGDGHLDAVVADHYNGPSQLFFGDGSGGFTDSGQHFVDPSGTFGNANDVQVADVNDDGYLDVVFAGRYDAPNQVWLNDGSGTFSLGQSFGGTFDARALALGDFGGAGLTEDGSFTIPTDDLLANDTDVDNGASLTFVGIGTTSTHGSVSYENGQIVYSPNGAYETLALGETGIDTFAYTISDEHGATSIATVTMTINGLNDAPVAHDDRLGDGHPDAFIAANHWGGTFASDSVWFNDGQGHLLDSGQALGDFQGYGVALGDINGDGVLDAVVTGRTQSYGSFGSTYTNTTQIWLNDGHGTFSQSPVDLGTFGSGDVQLVDLDGDGNVDIVASGWGDNEFAILWNEGGGTAFYAETPVGSYAHADSFAIADFDGDGDLDIAVSTENDGTYILVNTGGGNFYDRGLYVSSSYGYALTAGDVNGDGSIDLIMGGTFFSQGEVFLNNGAGSFYTSIALPSDSYGMFDLKLADLDGDGDLDLIGAGPDGAHVWFNDGNGTFGYSVMPSFASTDVALSDVNGDGNLDAVVTGYRSFFFGTYAETHVLLGDGHGGFSGAATFGETGGSEVHLADLNHDGHDDMVVVGYENVQVLINDGTGSFYQMEHLPDLGGRVTRWSVTSTATASTTS